MCKGGTVVGRSRVLWTRREFGIRILNGLIVLMLEIITHLVICSGRNFNTGEGSAVRPPHRAENEACCVWKNAAVKQPPVSSLAFKTFHSSGEKPVAVPTARVR